MFLVLAAFALSALALIIAISAWVVVSDLRAYVYFDWKKEQR